MPDLRLPALLLSRGWTRATHAGRKALVHGAALEWWRDLEAPSGVTLHRVATVEGIDVRELRGMLERMGR